MPKLCDASTAVFLEKWLSETVFADMLSIHSIHIVKGFGAFDGAINKTNSRDADISAICRWHFSFHADEAIRL